MSTVAVDGVLLAGHKGLAVEVPFDPAERWQIEQVPLEPGRRGYRVRARLKRTAFDSAVVSRMRRFFVLIPQDVAKGLKAGARVRVSLTPAADAPALTFRQATRKDLETIVRMLADDPLGAGRETFSIPLPASYGAAFEAIRKDRNNELIVAYRGQDVVGVLQLTHIPSLTYRGGWRAQIEGVRVDSAARRAGVGKALFEWAIGRARVRGCHVVQLTTDKARPAAKKFYEGLGFVASHEGMKLSLARVR